MRRKIQCLLVGLLVSGFLIYPAFAESSFPDVDEYLEYAEAVEYVNKLGIMVGDEHGNFNPYSTVTRAEMATIVCRMLDEADNLPSSTAFTDVPVGHWANAYVGRAAELGIVSGYGGGIFGPSDNVTYEQAVTMIVRAIGGGEAATKYGGYPDGFLTVAAEAELTAAIHSEKGEYLSRADIAMILYAHYCNIVVS